MTTGLSGSYAFNGTNLTLQPSEGKWIERTNYGLDGDAHPIYSAKRSFELSWDLESTSDAKQIIDFYNLISVTGSLVACLPKWGDSQYLFFNYSGTTLQEPTFEAYFMGYPSRARMLIINILT